MVVRRLWCSAFALSAVLVAHPTLADEKAQCASAYEQAQELRGQAKLREARNNLLVCAQAACPAFIKKDCSKWLSEVEAALPTVVLSAKAKGSDLTDVTVKMDGEEIVDVLDGRAVPVDPGPHTFVFESEKHGTKEVRYVVKEGQKSQSLEIDFGGDSAAAGGDDPSSDSSATLTTDEAAKSPVLAYALLGVGVVGLGGFAYFGLTANSDKDGLACADSKTCTDDDLDPIRQKYLFADISLGIGLVSLGVGTYLLLTGDEQKPAANADSAAVRFDVVPSRAGGFASVSGNF